MGPHRLIIILGAAIILSGCVTLGTDYRRIGFQEFQKGYSARHEPAPFTDVAGFNRDTDA